MKQRGILSTAITNQKVAVNKEEKAMKEIFGNLTIEKVMNDLSYKFVPGKPELLISTAFAPDSANETDRLFAYSYNYERYHDKLYSISRGWIAFVHHEVLYVARATKQVIALLHWHGYEFSGCYPPIPLTHARPQSAYAHIQGPDW